MSLVSPVFHRMICGHFKERSSKRLELENVDQAEFAKLLELSCGKTVSVGDLRDLMSLASLADLWQVLEVRDELEKEIVRRLTFGNCAELLSDALTMGLPAVASSSRNLALQNFCDFSQTVGFMSLKEDVLASLLQDDRLVAGSEEEIFETLVRWMKGGGEGLRGLELLDKVDVLILH